MIRPTVRDKLLPDALRQGLLQSVLVFALSAARVGGIYAPWALAAAAVSGGKSRGYGRCWAQASARWCFSISRRGCGSPPLPC